MERLFQSKGKVNLLDLARKIEKDFGINLDVEDPINEVSYSRLISQRKQTLVYSLYANSERLNLFQPKIDGFESLFISHEQPLPIERTNAVYITTNTKYFLKTFEPFETKNILLLSFFRDYDNQFKNLGKSITIERRVPNDQEMLMEALDYLVKKLQD